MGAVQSNVVGKIDLNAGNAGAIRRDIQKLLKSNWLDHDTVEDFYQKLNKRRDPNGLAALKREVEGEITYRQKAFGK